LKRKNLTIALIILVSVISSAFTLLAGAPPIPRPEPFLKYRFIVEIDGIVEASFLEVEGLNVTIDVIEFREGGDPSAVMLIPGLPHYGPLVLRNGLTESNELLHWLEKIAIGDLDRRNLSIVILNPEGTEAARYNVWNAWPSGWKLGKLDSLGVGPIIEELVIQYEGFVRAGASD